MQSKFRVNKSSKAVKQRDHCTSRTNHTRQSNSCQKPKRRSKAQMIASVLILVTYALAFVAFATAFFVTQNYAMLTIINVIVHELGYILRRMIESLFPQKRNKKKGHKKKQ